MNYYRRPFVATLLVLCLAAPLLWLSSRSAEAQSPPPVDLSDDFNDNSLDTTTKWNINAPGSPAVVSEQGQVLQIALPPSTATYNGIGSKTTQDMRDKTVEVEVVQPVSQAGWAENFIQVVLDAQNYYLISAGAGSMVFRSMVAGVNDQLVLNYDPVACRFWGIRHDEASNKVSLQTSPDGVTWTTRKRVTAGFSLSAVYFYLYAGAYGTGNSNPGAAKYDNFQVVPSSSRAVNVASATNGAFATASSTYSLSYQASSTINNDRKGVNWGNNGGWHDVPPGNTFPDWLQVDFEGDKTIGEVDVFSVQDNYASPAEPTETMTFTLYGLTGYQVQYWNGTTWVNIPGASVTGNNLVWRKFIFAPLTTSKIRVLTNASADGYSRITEVEAYTPVVHPVAARWQFDEGSGTTANDSSGNGNTGTIQDATWTTGQVGTGALDFNGTSSFVSVNSSPQLTSVSNNFTLSFWANPRSTHQIDPETTSGFGGTSGQKYAFGPRWYFNGDAGAGISVGTNGISVYEHAADYMPATLVYQGTLSGWTHIVLVYKNKQPSLYVNGVLVRTGLTSPMNSVHIQPVHIGAMAYGCFDGKLDEMIIYKDSFTTADVQALYTSYQTAMEKGMMSFVTAASPPSTNIQLFKEFKGVDIASVGVGGLRDQGFGNITVSGVSGTIKQAFLYWHGSNINTELNLGGALAVSYVVNNQLFSSAVGGTFLGKSADNFWPHPAFPFPIYPNTTAWRADITSLVNHGGPNKTYSLFAFNSFPNFNPNGASIIIIYNDATSSNDFDLRIYDGNDSNSHSTFDSDGWFIPLTNVEYGSGTALIDMHVADGQTHLNDPEMRMNNLPWLSGNPFTGIGVSALWDINTYNITQFVQHGTNNLTITSPPAPPPPLRLDGLNLIAAVVKVPTVREVKTLTWEKIDSTIDDNPNFGGGKRIFPDWQTPGDSTNRQVVRVKAETTMGQGQTVFFRSFDVDDPDTNITIDPNGNAGDDNRGSPKPGTLNAASATTDSNGVATVVFTTTMHPGDNFMVAASADSNYLNGVVVNFSGLKDAANNNLPTNNAKATPMLTVWRRLHVEVDSMGPVVGNKITGSITLISPAIGCSFFNCPPNTMTYAIYIDRSVETSRYDHEGTMTIGGVRYPVLGLSNGAPGQAVVIAVPETGPEPSGSTYTLVDDDDYNSNNDGNGDEGEDVNALSDTFDWMQQSDDPAKNVFAAAYIMPIRDGGGPANNSYDESNLLFRLNVPDSLVIAGGLFNANSTVHENDAFWVVYLLLAYQGENNSDHDLNSERLLEGGVTWGTSANSVTSKEEVFGLGANGSVIYLETMRDRDADPFDRTTTPISTANPPYDYRKRSAPHEIGHQMGLKGDDGPQWGLMNERGTPVFVSAHLNILRWRVRSPKFPQ